jgi:hypothetical protein
MSFYISGSKKCNKCLLEVSLTDFNMKLERRDTVCKHCKAKYNRAYREKNPETMKAARENWVKRNPEYAGKYQKDNREAANAATRRSYHKDVAKSQARARGYVSKNPEASLEAQRKWREKNRERERVRGIAYAAANLDKGRAATARRRARKLSATPTWASDFIISEIYELAHERTSATGVMHHVDHIVPLQGKAVCGLHVEANLRVITALENLQKKNKLMEVA